MHLSCFRPSTNQTARKEIMRNRKKLLTFAMAALSLQLLASCFTYKKEETSTPAPAIVTTPAPAVVTVPPTTTSETTTTTTTDDGTTRRSTTTNY